MKFAAIDTTALLEIAIGGAVIFGLLYYVKRQSSQAVDSFTSKVGQTVSTTLNPASPENFIYKGVNAAGSAMTGESNFDLGGWVYDVFHPSQTLEDQQAAQTGNSGAAPMTTAAGF